MHITTFVLSAITLGPTMSCATVWWLVSPEPLNFFLHQFSVLSLPCLCLPHASSLDLRQLCTCLAVLTHWLKRKITVSLWGKRLMTDKLLWGKYTAERTLQLSRGLKVSSAIFSEVLFVFVTCRPFVCSSFPLFNNIVACCLLTCWLHLQDIVCVKKILQF